MNFHTGCQSTYRHTKSQKVSEERRFAHQRICLLSNFVSGHGFIHLQGAI